MAGCVQKRPGSGLSALARQDYIARVKRETNQKFAAIRGFVKGHYGVISADTLSALKNDKIFAKTADIAAYVAAVLRLDDNLHVEVSEAGVRFIVNRMAA